MHRQYHAGFTRTELLVALVIIAVVLTVAFTSGFFCILTPAAIQKGQMTQTLSNMKELHRATQQMAIDGMTTKNTNLGWPGDSGGTFTNWTARLTQGGYFTTNDMCEILSAPGRKVPTDKLPGRMSDTALLVYAVRSNSEPDAVFLSTANYIFARRPLAGIANPRADPLRVRDFFDSIVGIISPDSRFKGILDPKAIPYGDKGFIVFHKDGEGRIYASSRPGRNDTIGSHVPLCR